MNPWLLFWAPHLHLPFGGSVAQRIEPNTNWFFDSIPATAGDATVERKAFEVASYGRQLGWITEVLLDIAAEAAPTTDQGKKSLTRLKKIQAEMEALKKRDAEQLVDEIEALLARLRKTHKTRFPQLRQRIEQRLAEEARSAATEVAAEAAEVSTQVLP